MMGVFEAIEDVAAARHVRYFVVGATARDMILSHGYGIPIKRATADIDLGVEVASLAEFHALKEGLAATGQFKPTQSTQRLIYKGSVPVDIVPFGPLEHVKKEISWSPNHSVRMNVLGFEDAYRDAQMVRLKSDPALDISFATPAGLAVLKIIAWKDRSPQGGKDAGDLAFLMRNYLDAGNQERLADEHRDLLNDDDFDYERASARLLGRDMAEVMSAETRKVVFEILELETVNPKQYRLVEDMVDNYEVTGDEFEKCLGHLEALKAGVQEG